MSDEDGDKAVQVWKIKKLVRQLTDARGNGTSMISLILPPKSDVARANKMLSDEYGTASNIKSRVNRLSVLSAITSTQARLKLWSKVPPNGLCVFVGTILTDENKERKITFDFEPFRPINTSLYLCDNRFHTEALADLLEDDQKFGFLIMDGNGSLFGTLQGNHREILHKFTVDLPKKHGRGGQSALRFARLRLEKRHNYLRKVAETAVQQFITGDRPNVKGLILAGSAEFKNDLANSDLFDKRLLDVVIQLVDVSYGGENGFNQAIELSADALSNVKFIHEKKLIARYFDQIAQDTGKFCFGVLDTVRALEMGAAETTIIWENLATIRAELRNAATGETSVQYLKDKSELAQKFTDETGADLEVVTSELFVEYLAENYKQFGTTIEIISDKSQDGTQFVKGFGGVGAILRYQVDFEMMEEPEECDFDYDSDY
eukprot:TRINITY_DN1781_c0_g3_i1.p1 TRINITY_DN1781_c0_g3~~TRINITY_DN1781_c0_g3_i1.p1  ORF type:complete len:433 (+),score=109.92 TRINITY_DN1781_c0_g3_i1:116-1414(+)